MMFEDNICLNSDSYKMGHHKMYMDNTTGVYSYLEARTGAKYNKTVFYGLQYIIKRYLCGQVVTQEKIDEAEYIIEQHLGKGFFNRAGWEYILNVHNGKLPIRISAVPEGTPVDVSNVMMTVVNTDKNVPWLTNFLETLLSHVWYSSTVATTSREIKILLSHYLNLTSDSEDSLPFMLHDFGMRGATSSESAAIAGSAHLINFKGTDTVSALMIPIKYYNSSEVVGFSVAATEHSIMTARGEDGEFEVVDNIFDKFPNDILSIVIDSYNFENFLEKMGTTYKERILNRTGRTVFRPDSGEPNSTTLRCFEIVDTHFGHTINSRGYKVLPSNIRILWGDGIDYTGIRSILYTLNNNGWAAENMIFGCGGGLVQRCDRDTQRLAFKCSSQEYDNQWHDVWKKPLDLTKASKRGQLALIKDETGKFITKQIHVLKSSEMNYLNYVFENGTLLKDYTFEDVRKNSKI